MVGINTVYVLETHGHAHHSNRTRHIFYPAIMFETSTGTEVIANSTYKDLNIAIADSINTTIMGQVMLPTDMVTLTNISLVWRAIAAKTALDIYWDNAWYVSGNGETYSTHTFTTSGFATTHTSLIGYTYVTDIDNGVDFSALTASDILKFYVTRVGGNAGDTYTGAIHFLGFLLTYTGDM